MYVVLPTCIHNMSISLSFRFCQWHLVEFPSTEPAILQTNSSFPNHRGELQYWKISKFISRKWKRNECRVEMEGNWENLQVAGKRSFQIRIVQYWHSKLAFVSHINIYNLNWLNWIATLLTVQPFRHSTVLPNGIQQNKYSTILLIIRINNIWLKGMQRSFASLIETKHSIRISS